MIKITAFLSQRNKSNIHSHVCVLGDLMCLYACVYVYMSECVSVYV